MSELKTKPTKNSVLKFLNSITPQEKQADGIALLKLFKKVTGKKAVMWGTSIVGFGMYHYKSERSTQEGDWPLVGFSPRKQNLTLYIMAGNKSDPQLMKKLGKHKTSGGCLYINKLSDVDEKMLVPLIKRSYEFMKKKFQVR
jgi:hypothetical protein